MIIYRGYVKIIYMKKEYFLLIILLVILVSAMILKFVPIRLSAPERVRPNIITPDKPIAPSIDKPIVDESDIASSSVVIIKRPLPGNIVTSPLIVEGQARGGWFFEATLPIKLTTQNGDIILAHYGTAQTDWMTADFVPFVSVLEFNTTATSGYLVIAKDNPSGLPEFDDSIKIPVLFK